MRNLAVLVIHLIATLARLLGPGGVRSLVAESLLLKHQLLSINLLISSLESTNRFGQVYGTSDASKTQSGLIVNRSRQRSPNLSAGDRILAGLLAHLVRPTRLLRSAIALKPLTLLGLQKALSEQRYRVLFSPNRRRKPGPKGPSADCDLKAARNDCLTRRKSIRPCVPSHVAYEVGAARQQTVRSPRTTHSQEWHRNREATVYLPARILPG